MGKAGRKMLRGAKEALAYARCNCDHEWVHKRAKNPRATWVRHCRKCGVRVTEFERK